MIMGYEAYLVDGVRTPIGSFGGSLSAIRTDDLAAHIIRSLVAKVPNIPTELIDDVILGCHNQAGEDNRNVARMALLLAGLPVHVPGETVNRLCASGMSSIVQAARAVSVGDGDLFIAGGVEHMTRGPLVISKASSAYGTDAKMYDSSFGWRFVNPQMEALYGVDPMGITAENLVDLYHISREDQDLFAFHSQRKAAEAQAKGRFDEEIIPVEIPQRKAAPIVVSTDEFIKPSTSLSTLSRLRPEFRKDGSVTAGNASGLNDGAAAVFIASDRAVQKYDLKPLAKIVASSVVGVAPRIMGIGPVDATRKVLQRAGLTIDQIDIIELNEAFAAQSLACIRELGLADDDPRINVNGGAIALGHPLGMSGTRITYTAALELRKRQKKYALATMCVGVGQGYALILESV